MVRYFFRFGYIGTKYRGTQKQTETSNTVQQAIEIALLSTLKCPELPKTHFASRTDKGVHALTNTLHVDLNHKLPNESYQPHFIRTALNQYFVENDHDIRINHASIVSDRFHARFHAKWRSYFYRLAILRPEIHNVPLNNCQEYLPICEIDRCFAVPSELNTSLVKHVADAYCGQHDFTAFTRYLVRDPWKNPVRVIDECRFYETPFSSFMNDPQYDKISIWEFYVQSKGFLYHQVRKLVGAAVAAGLGTVSLPEVESILRDPDPGALGKVHIPPPCGLYLADVHYDMADFTLNKNPEIQNEVLAQSN